jgi:hypothetical protein
MALWLLVPAGLFVFLMSPVVTKLNSIITLPAPCSTPLAYHIGTIDPRFGLSRFEANDDLVHATAIWNKVERKTLFQYDENSGLPVNFVYGDVQYRRDEKAPLVDAVERNRASEESLSQEKARLVDQYNDAKHQLEIDTASFRDALSAHNAMVQQWNASPSRTPEDRVALSQEESSLMNHKADLDQRASALNELADRINSLVSEHNSLVDEDRERIGDINRDAGTLHVAGMYHAAEGAKSIDIYEVANQSSLITLLAHELGHALGLGHNGDPASIMAASGDDPGYGQNDSGEPKSPSAEDIAALKAVCRS